jgi:hypothetical protein
MRICQIEAHENMSNWTSWEYVKLKLMRICQIEAHENMSNWSLWEYVKLKLMRICQIEAHENMSNWSNIPAAPAYGVYISQLIRYSRACGSYQDFLDRELLLTGNILNQWFLLVNMKSSLRTFYDRHHDLVDRYGISASHMTTDMFHLS